MEYAIIFEPDLFERGGFTVVERTAGEHWRKLQSVGSLDAAIRLVADFSNKKILIKIEVLE